MDALMLLRVVRVVAALADTDEPAAATQRAFDAAAARCEEHAGLPPARRIAERLGLPWRDVLKVAHAPEAEQSKLLGLRTRRSVADWLTADHAAAMLALVATRLATRSPSQREYRSERERIIGRAASRGRSRAGLAVPTDAQILAVCGSWDTALRQAGLVATAVRSCSPGRAAPSLVDLLARFHSTHGFQPSARELRSFARGNALPYPSERSQRFAAAVAEWRRERVEAGLPEPRVVSKPGGRGRRGPDYSADVVARRENEHRRTRWTEATCAAAVARYLSQLASGERSTERGYEQWAAEEPAGTVPAVSTIVSRGGWEGVRRQAQRLLGAASATR